LFPRLIALISGRPGLLIGPDPVLAIAGQAGLGC